MQTAIRDVYSWRVKETERMKVGGSVAHVGTFTSCALLGVIC